jgi:hypothetical protein
METFLPSNGILEKEPNARSFRMSRANPATREETDPFEQEVFTFEKELIKTGVALVGKNGFFSVKTDPCHPKTLNFNGIGT